MSISDFGSPFTCDPFADQLEPFTPEQFCMLSIDSDSDEGEVTELGARTAIKAARAAKTVIESETGLNKVKASTNYTFGEKFRLRVGLPLKNLFVALSPDDLRDIELFKKHNEFCSGIDKVKKAYTQYSAAQQAVTEVEDDSKLKRARLEEHGKSLDLVDRYNDLIKLAADLAEQKEFKSSSTQLKSDITNVLNATGDGNILSTINMVLPKISMENGTVSQDKIEQGYIRFVSNFAEYVHRAVVASGKNDPKTVKMITDAFIKGLASIPEMRDNLSIIHCHAVLVNMRNPDRVEETDELVEVKAAAIASRPEELINSFTRKLNDLINGDQLITMSALRGIQDQGISLLSVHPCTQTGIANLNALQASKKSLKDAMVQLRGLEQEHTILVESLAVAGNYSVSEIQEYLSDPALELPSVFSTYSQVSAKIQAVNQQIEGLAALYAEQKAENDAKIAEARALVQTYEGEIADLEETISNKNREIDLKQKEIADLTNGYDSAEARWKKKIGKDDEVIDYFLVDSLASGKVKFEAKKTAVQALIDNAEDVMNAALGVKSETEARLTQAAEALIKLADEVADFEESHQEFFNALIAERQVLAKTNITPSGNDMKALSDFLESGKVAVNAQTIFGRLLAWACQVHSEKTEIEQELVSQQEKVDGCIDDMSSMLLDLDGMIGYTPDAGFAFDPDVTFDQAVIQERLNSNWDIAKEITVRVGDALVEGETNKLRAVSEKPGVTVEQKRALDGAALTVTREARPIKEMEDAKLYKVIVDRVNELQEEEVQFDPDVVVYKYDPNAAISSDLDGESNVSTEALAQVSSVSLGEEHLEQDEY